MRKIELDTGKIEQLYKSGLSCPEIGKMLGMRALVINRHLKKMGIPLRNHLESSSLKNGVVIGGATYRNKEWLIEHYVNKRMSLQQIANICNASAGTIHRWMQKHGIKCRKVWEGSAAVRKIDLDCDKIAALYLSGKSTLEIGNIFGVHYGIITNRLKSSGIKIRNRLNQKVPSKEAIQTYMNKEWLQYQYCSLKKSQADMAKLCRCSQGLIGIWMKRFGISARTPEDIVKHFNVNITSKELFNGLLLGDGGLANPSSVAAHYSHTDKHERFLEWLIKKFAEHKIGTGKIRTVHPITQRGTKCTAYQVTTRAYAEFLDMYNQWYPNGKRTLPDNIELTPTTCLLWYLGDGGLNSGHTYRADLRLSTCCFAKKDVLRLIGKLGELGISANYWPSNNSIGIGVDNTPKFLAYIGPCPKEIWQCYGYKWDLTRSKAQWEAEFANGTV